MSGNIMADIYGCAINLGARWVETHNYVCDSHSIALFQISSVRSKYDSVDEFALRYGSSVVAQNNAD